MGPENTVAPGLITPFRRQVRRSRSLPRGAQRRERGVKYGLSGVLHHIEERHPVHVCEVAVGVRANSLWAPISPKLAAGRVFGLCMEASDTARPVVCDTAPRLLAQEVAVRQMGPGEAEWLTAGPAGNLDMTQPLACDHFKCRQQVSISRKQD
jgi:hypothetical protein